MDLTLQRERSGPSCQDAALLLTVSSGAAFLLFFPSLLLGLQIQNRQLCHCVLAGIMPGIKVKGATGCSAHSIDDVIRAADDTRRMSLHSNRRGKSQEILETGLLLMRNPHSTGPKLSTRRVITGFAPPEQRTAEQAAAGWLWRPGATTAGRLRARRHGIVSERNSGIRRYSLLIGSSGGGRETAGYRVSCP